VRTYDAFNEGNDPFGEHDFGFFAHNGRTIFWKVDYHDRYMNYGSPDAADPELSRRVLTVLLADEW
jgi:hypothetical protein